MCGDVNHETNFPENWLTSLGLGVAERRSLPGGGARLPRSLPQGGGAAVIILQPVSNHSPKLFEQQLEKGLALAQSPAQTVRVVVVEGAGGAAFEAAPGR